MLAFDLFLDLRSCFGDGAVYLFDEEVRAFRTCLRVSSSVGVRASAWRRRIIPVRPVCVDEDEETDTYTDCGECEDDGDCDARSDLPEWGFSDSEDEGDGWSFDADQDEGEFGDENEDEDDEEEVVLESKKL